VVVAASILTDTGDDMVEVLDGGKDAAPTLPTMVEHALTYAARGWAVIPLHTPGPSGCSCHKRDCASNGKHPRVQHGLTEASKDPVVLRQWWGMWPNANIGIVCGRVSGLVVVDIDPRNGGARPNGCPPTLEAQTGGGGQHLLYAWPSDSDGRWPKAIAPGVDLKADGGYIVAPPSLHASGQRYAWADEFAATIDDPAPLPAFVLTAMRARKAKVIDIDDGAPIPEGHRNNRLTSVAGKLRRAGAGPTGILAELAEQNRTRCQPPLDGAELESIVQSVVRYPAGKEADSPPVVAPPVVEDRTDAGEDQEALRATQSYAFLVQILRHSTRLLTGGDCLEWDEMHEVIALDGRDIDDGLVGRIMEAGERHFFHATTGGRLRFPSTLVERAIDHVARERAFHPVERYLRGLVWDGTRRLDDVAPKILAQAESDLAPLLVRRWFLAAARRALHAPCKADTMLILRGPQGIGKSRFFSTLTSPWFSDSFVDVHSKDAAGSMQAAWCIEWAELESMQKARESDIVKAFLSQETDTYRPPYARFTVTRHRRSVVVGTTNADEFLRDSSGSRRFWVVACPSVDIERLAGERDQLWAEAVEAVAAGEPHWLDGEMAEGLETENAAVRVGDDWLDPVAHYLIGRDEVTTADLLAGPLNKPTGQWTGGDRMRAATVLRHLGWQRIRPQRGGVRAVLWTRGTTGGTAGGSDA
jgi:hypothetical protein